MVQTADAFLSYSREGKTRVLDLAARLRAAGVDLWNDPDLVSLRDLPEFQALLQRG